jgi:hypothetical protein
MSDINNYDKSDLIPVKVRIGDQIIEGKKTPDGKSVILSDGKVIRIDKNKPAQNEEAVSQAPLQTEETKIEEKPQKERKSFLSFIKKEKRVKKEKTPRKEKPKKEKKAKGEVDPEIVAIRKRKFLVSALYIVGIIALLVVGKAYLNSQQEEIAVIMLKTDKLAGEIVREEDIEEYKMLKRTYDELGTVTYKDDNGITSQKQIIYKWDETDEVINKYMANFTQTGQYLTLKNVTDKKVIRNPWLSEVEEGNEIYTLDIDTEGINTRLLLPGTRLRARAVLQVDNVSNISSVSLTNNENNNLEEGLNIVQSTNDKNTLNKDSLLKMGTSIPQVEIIFDDMICVDMLNSNGESLFDIYMALYKLPVGERLEYIETTIEEGNALSFQKRVTPTSLVFILDKDQATNMTKYENLENVSIKYTILPFTDDTGNLLSNFTEIADQMSDLIEQSNLSVNEQD